MTEVLITITRFGSDEEVLEWFHALRAASDAAETPEDFPQHLRDRADAFDRAMVEEFLQALRDAGDGALGELLELEDQMPRLYWAYQPQEEIPVESSPEADRFDWVDGEQASRLSAAWGDDWRAYLPERLSTRWGDGWEAQPADYKQAWLTDLLPELLPELLGELLGETQETQPADGSDDPFDWVTDEQSDRLVSGWAADWRSLLDEQLSERWGSDWQTHPGEHKRAWFADLLPELLSALEEPAEPDDDDGDEWEAEAGEVMAELRSALLEASSATTQEG